jgi:ectoine hydroxylase-related dioxygenase (phytanoyl-CoA dioxygenase family)
MSQADLPDLEDALAHYRSHGWARLGRVADDETLAALRARADDIMLGRVVHEGLFFQHDSESGRYEDLEFGRGYVGPSEAYRKIEKLERDPVFRAWIENPVFERVVRAVLGNEGVAVYRATLFTKSARGGTELPWHQDGGSFWGLDRDPDLQVWTAIDDASSSSGCVEVVDASHTSGLATPLGGTIPRDLVVEARADERKIGLEARAGDVLLIHNYLWHRSGNNTSGRTRRAFTISYMPSSIRCTRKRRAPRQFVRVFDRARVG